MSEITFKTYGDLEVAESLSEASNMIIEQNGEVKRYPASGIQSDWNASEGEPGYIKNRTHYKKESLLPALGEITWDGNTEGLTEVVMGTYDYYYKVSDIVPSNARIKAATFSTDTEGPYPLALFDNWEEDVYLDDYVYTDHVVFIRKDDVTISLWGDNVFFPYKGIYFQKTRNYNNEIIGFTTALTLPEVVETEVKTINKEFLPDYLQFGDVSGVLTWDGNTNGLISVDLYGDGSMFLYQVSDSIVTLDNVKNGFNYELDLFGSKMEEVAQPSDIGVSGVNSEITYIYNENVFFVTIDNAEHNGAIFPKAGVYLVAGVPIYVSSVTIPGYVGFEEKLYKPIDSKYLPKIEKFYINGDKYLYRDVNCTTKASVDDIPDSCAIEIGRSVFFESAGTEKVIGWYNPVWVTSYYESFNRGYRTVAVIDEDGNCIKAYTAEYSPSAPT